MKSAVQQRKYRHLLGVFFLALAVAGNGAFAEKTKKPKLPKSYESKAAPPEISDADRMFIDLREAAKKNDVFRTQRSEEHTSELQSH